MEKGNIKNINNFLLHNINRKTMAEAVDVRTPLADRSKQFRNNRTNPLVQQRVENEFVKPQKRVISIEQQQQQHSFQLTHSAKPIEQPIDMLGTSTPKKDGHVPFLTSTTNTSTANTSAAASAPKKAQTYEKELTKWQQTWRSILPSQHIYFEHDESHDKDRKRAMLSLKSLGAKIELFFDENITIIVSRRPYDSKFQYPQGDIFRIVNKKQIKVWSIEKVFRFMKHLDADIPDYSSQNDAQLESLLQNERIFGSNDRDPLAKRDDMKYFIGPYLYVYDLSQRLRPVVIKEWKDQKDCTKINKSTNGKSLFVEETKSTLQSNLLKRHKRRLQNLDECTDYRIQLEAACFPKNCPKLYRRSYNERVEYAMEFLKTYYSKKPLEDPKVKYKGSGLEDFFEKMIKKDHLLPILNNEREYNGDDNRNYSDYDNDLDIELIQAQKKIKLNNETDDKDDKFSNMLDDNPDQIDELTRHKRSILPKKIDKIMFDVPNLPAPPIQLRRENSVFTPQNQPQNQIEQQNLLCNYGEIVASGVTQSGSNLNGGGGGNVLSQGNQGGNGLGPSRASVTNRALLKDSQRTMVLPMTTVSIGKPKSNTIIMQQGDSTIPNDTDIELSSTDKRRVSIQRRANKLLVTLKLSNEKLDQIKKRSPFIALKNRIENEEIKNLALQLIPQTQNQPKKKKVEEKKKHEMKPGYCENCRVKYTDFDDHCISENHRQFALNSKNFAEIDRLICKVSLRR